MSEGANNVRVSPTELNADEWRIYTVYPYIKRIHTLHQATMWFVCFMGLFILHGVPILDLQDPHIEHTECMYR